MVENKYYERKIRYLDLMENGDRTGGAGFIKTEVKGMDINFAVTVKGLHPTDTYERDVMLQVGNGEFSVGRISLKEGQGQFIYHAVMDYEQLQGIRIVLGGTREICCKWQENRRTNDNGKSGGQGKETSKVSEWENTERDNIVRNNMIQNNAEQNDETQNGKIRYNEASGGSGRKKAVLGSILTQSDNGEKRKAKERREIQLIPWDEVRAAEESLEMTEKLLADTEERAAALERMKSAEETAALERIRLAERAAVSERMKSTERRGTAESVKPAGGMSVTESMGLAEEMAESKSAESAEITGSERDIGKIMPRAAERVSVRERNRTAERDTQNTPTGRASERRTEKSVRKSTAVNAARGEKTPVRLLEDKWQQIWAIYPHIHPFQDEREYLSISPADFVLLSGEAYRAANNSFLLHGYYNYDHLILTKIERRGEVSYYIGVPGNYYEREKQVAVMFGFESFECGTEPAQAGDFGYYMMRTQL
ncbi:MAG: hypothetical protein HFH06_12385 [Lachnospiraceae bacterium]|nr:hypothetical protein [Lachnospiraceae bacterium]